MRINCGNIMETLRIFGFLILLAVYVNSQSTAHISVPSICIEQGSGNDPDECASNPCLHGGACTSQNDAWTCACPAGYTGEVCQNDGEYSNDEADFHLDIEVLYLGELLDIDFSDANSATSLRFGELFCAWISQLISTMTAWEQYFSSCIIKSSSKTNLNQVDVMVAAYFHDIDDGNTLVYDVGERIKQESECLSVVHITIHVLDPVPCSNSPCLNGGICHENAGHVQCQCPQGYLGVNCEQEVNECESEPCRNGGTCQDLIPGYSCVCQPQWKGQVCQDSIGHPDILTIVITVDGTDPNGEVKWIATWTDNSQLSSTAYELEWYAQARGLTTLADAADRTLLKTSKYYIPILNNQDTLEQSYITSVFGQDLIVQIRASYTIGTTPLEWSTYKVSEPFKTGFHTETAKIYSITAEPSSGIVPHPIDFYTPIICRQSYTSLGRCYLEVRFKMFYVEGYDVVYGRSCQKGYELVPTLVTDGCTLQVPRSTTSSKAEKTFQAVYYNTPGRARRVFKIYMYTNAVPASPLWSNLDLAYFYVVVYQPRQVPTASLLCRVYNDPHIAPFKNTPFRSYDYHPDGTKEQVLYNYEPEAQEDTNKYSPYIPKTIVTAIFAPCPGLSFGSNAARSLCQCAGAVRVANDIITVDVCTGHNRFSRRPPLYWYGGTTDSNGNRVKPSGLNAYLKGKTLLITLPTGASVLFSLRLPAKLLDIQVTPSMMDVGRTNGMCGMIDALVMRDGTAVTQRSQIVPLGLDWEAQAAEGEDIILEGYTSAWSTDRATNKLCQCGSYSVCSEKELTRTCRSKNFRLINQQLRADDQKRRGRGGRRRKKRDLAEGDMYGDELFGSHHHIQKRAAVAPADVEDVCEATIKNSSLSQECYTYIPDIIEESYITCVFDLGTFLDDSWVQRTFEVVKTACLTFLNNNPSLTNNTVSIPDVNSTGTDQDLDPEAPPDNIFISDGGGGGIFDILCPLDCSGQGTCSQAVCTCNDGWGGIDCAQDATITPTLIQIEVSDVCDQLTSQCSGLIIGGSDIVDSENLTCRFRGIQLQGTTDQLDTYYGKGTALLFDQISCDLPFDLVRKNLTVAMAFNVSVQNNPDAQFSNSLKYLVYLSSCQTCDSSNGCTTKNGTCRIPDGLGDDVCWNDGELNPDSSCQFCSPTDNTGAWTLNDTYCYIGSTCYDTGQEDPNQPGEICDPAVNPNEWQDINECDSNPCVNNGTCWEGLNSYNCTCEFGWSGINCEDDVVDCLSQPCQNGGVCTDDLLMYTCACTGGYTGVNCETEIDECNPDPCVNGNCTDLLGDYVCRCDAGYIGKNCSEDILECASNPCENNGTCHEGLLEYNCSCTPEYTGKYCRDIANITTEGTTSSPTTTPSPPTASPPTPSPATASPPTPATSAPTTAAAPSSPAPSPSTEIMTEETETTTPTEAPTTTTRDLLTYWNGFAYLRHLIFDAILYNKSSIRYKELAEEFCARIARTAASSNVINTRFGKCLVHGFSPGSVIANFSIGLEGHFPGEELYTFHTDLKKVLDDEIAKLNGTFSDWYITDVTFVPKERPVTGPRTSLIAIIVASVVVALLLIILVTCLIFYYRPKQRQSPEESSVPSESSFTENSFHHADIPTRYTPYGIGGRPTWGYGPRW